ncbi:MAG: cell division protein FtsQ/DivIB [Gammaproteobacteria bacterium]|nr:cell division protein FtsQ/DivIB [Gammaproteobacteria bacterium]
MATGATSKANKPGVLAGAARTGRALLGVLAGVAVIAALLLAARELSQLPIERIVVSGDLQRVSRSQLRSMVTESLQGGFLWADLQNVRAPLEQLPWVFRVVVKRRWPNSLEIEVTEQLPIARWGQDGFVNHEGEVFRPQVTETLDELPLLSGPAASQLLLMQHYMRMQEQLARVELQLLELSMNDRGGLRARLSNGTELVLGRGDMEEKIQRFLGVYHADLVSRATRVRSVDLRYEYGLAVAWTTG